MLHLESSSDHEQHNPYTAVQRSASQHFVYMPDAPPMPAMTTITLSMDAVNLNSIPASIPPSSCSEVSFQSRYIVPEMIRPAYGSSSDTDTRSAGNPYSHHPNFTTPSQYFDHLGGGNKETERDVLTITDIKNLENPFHKFSDMSAPAAQIHPPNDVTLNKMAFASQSLADIANLNMEFPTKGSSAQPSETHRRSDQTLNKKMLSPESMYELEQTPVNFKTEHEKPSNLLKIREFSPQSLADLREIRNISQYTELQDMTSSKDVDTCRGISPAPHEIRQFEWTENVAYGGI